MKKIDKYDLHLQDGLVRGFINSDEYRDLMYEKEDNLIEDTWNEYYDEHKK